MARRKVTMLEAFQRSARESAERAAAERRRVIAEREKESRRAETARAAQELGHRLSQRAGGGVGSLLAGIRGTGETLVGTSDEVASSQRVADGAPDATDIHRLAPGALPEAPGGATDDVEASVPERRGPALPAFDRASHGDLTQVASSPMASSAPAEAAPAPESPTAEALSAMGLSETPSSATEAPVSTEVGAHETGTPAGSSSAGSSASAVAEGEEAAEEPFGDATKEDVEHAIASLEDETFELPMGAKAFAMLSVAVLAAVFMVGYSVGRGSAPLAPVSPGDAATERPYGRSSAAGGPGPEMVFSAPARGRDLAAADEGRGAPLGSAPPNGAPSGGALAAPAGYGVPQGAIAASTGPSTAAAAVATPEDLAFQDEAMRFSILAITYTRTEAHARMALETYQFLYDQGFPAVHPVEDGNRIYVFVGAARTRAELEQLKQELREQKSARGSAEFRSAMLINTTPYR